MLRKLAPSLLIITILLAATYPYKAKKVIFFGDSITQAGVNPGGYIVKMDSIIKAAGLSDQYQLIGAGIGGTRSMIYISEWNRTYWQNLRMS